MPRVLLRSIDTPSERNFVIDSWLRSYEKSEFAHVVGRRYVLEHRACILRALDATSVVTLLACDLDDPDLVLGFICYEAPSVLHYIYVKSVFRRSGISRYLLESTVLAEADVLTCTHWTPSAMCIRAGAARRFNPYPFLRGPVDENQSGLRAPA